MPLVRRSWRSGFAIRLARLDGHPRRDAVHANPQNDDRKRKETVPRHLRPGVLFDVDGTLFDTNYLHTLTWSRAFADAREWVPMNAIHRLVGMGGDHIVVELLGHESPDAVAARPRRYEELFDEARPFPGAAGLLRHAHHKGLAV